MSRCGKFLHKSRFIMSLTILLAVGVSPLLAQSGDPRFQPSACPLPIPAGLNVDCGYLTVPEDHTQPDGASITLAVAILRSFNPQPQPDPVLFLQGGPGGPAIYYVLQDAWLRALEPILTNRDVIVFDPRGTGFSSPSLVCPEQLEIVLGSETTLTMLPDANRDSSLNEALFACRDRLNTEGIDLTAYTAVQNANDAALLREVLGYEQVNLLGLSYGTRVALTVMRDHPEGIRSVILDSTLPYDLNLAVEEPLATANAVDAVLDLCQSALLCRLGYPDLRPALFAMIDDLNVNPLSFTATNSDTGMAVSGVLTGDSLAQLLFGLLYNRVSVGFIPALVYTLREGDTDLLERIIFPSGAPDPAGFSSAAVQYAVICSDYAPYISEVPTPRDESVPAIFGRVGLFGSGAIQPICVRWGEVVLDPAAHQPVESDIPTLLLSGGLDHATPPAWAQRAAETLPNSHIVLFPNMTHSLIFSGEACPSEIAADFLDEPVTAPTMDCIGAIRPPEFTLAVPASRPYLSIAAFTLGTVALWNVGVAGCIAATGGHRRLAWRMSLRLVGFVGPVASFASMTLLYLIVRGGGATGFPMATTARFIELVVPLVVGVQAAFLFSPDDEPGIEVLMACPRPVSWLLLERFLVLIVLQSSVALMGVAFVIAVGGEDGIWVALVRWFAPSLFLGGLGAYVTIRSRQPAFGACVAGLLWFVFAFLGEALLPYAQTFYPLSLIQPFLWSFHAYLQPGDVPIGDYWLNRALLAALGVVFILLAVRLLRDEERILTGIRTQSQ